MEQGGGSGIPYDMIRTDCVGVSICLCAGTECALPVCHGIAGTAQYQWQFVGLSLRYESFMRSESLTETQSLSTSQYESQTQRGRMF